ncbi:uncharacterized protein [Periplaneta americana]|uniref:uncharacterized protein n=1 Tax=Periplaneta americana TaxID=6978 RepID=UPI0037E7E25A
MKAVVVVTMVTVFLGSVFCEEANFLCSEEVCKELIEQEPCEKLPKNCNISSPTFNGIMMLDPSVCNCCDFCLEYLNEGDDCVLDGTGQPLFKSVCGPGLWCKKEGNEEFPTCGRIDSECTKKQDEYDQKYEDGNLGFTQLRPQCDAKGEFKPAHCIAGSICYCINPDGERIFGEKVFSASSIQDQMTCECSLAAWKAEQLAKEMGVYSQSVHCLDDGRYDPLQCSDDMCRCLKTETNELDMSEDGILEINLMEGSPSCFDSKIHEKGRYKQKCEEKALKMMQEAQNLLDEGIIPIGFRLPDCQYDGRYSRVMVMDTEKICVDPDGNSLGYKILRNDSLSDIMDCNCARTRWLLEREEVEELPNCCSNGNFNRIQCRRGYCFCVDYNGNQEGLEVPEEDRDKVECGDGCASCASCNEKQGKASQGFLFPRNRLQWSEQDSPDYYY